MESVGFSNIVPYETGGIEISDIDAKPIKVPVYAPVNNFNPVSNRLELAIISLMKLSVNSLYKRFDSLIYNC